MDFSFFDVLLDSIFVINSEKKIVYCNEAAATLCQSSVRRMTGKKPIFEYIQFSDENMYAMPNGEEGKEKPYPLTEVEFKLKSSEEKGRVQLALQPVVGSKEDYWVVFLRDVTLEEVLHGKYKKQLEEKEVYINDLKKARQELQNYSENLEKMVEERTEELRQANSMLSAIMNSLGQGFLVFDDKGECLNIYTKACEEILECNPSGKDIVKVLNLTGEDETQFQMWMQAVFSKSLSFDSLKELAPNLYDHSQGSHITLDYFCIENDKEISKLVLVATDKTSEFEANKALEKEKSFAQMVVRLVTNKKQFIQFMDEFDNRVEEIKAFLNKKSVDVDHIFRVLHTIEGESASFSISEIKSLAKSVQNIISPVRLGEIEFADIKDEFMKSMGYLEEGYRNFNQEHESLLTTIVSKKEEGLQIDKATIEKFYSEFLSSGADKKTCERFYSYFTKEPVAQSIEHYNTLVQNIAQQQNKKIAPIKIIGGDFRIDVNYFNDLMTSLVHAFRNIVDHGIENRDERLEAKKPEQATIQIVVEVSDERLGLKISDDGKGIDPSIIKKKHAESAPDFDFTGMNDEDIIQLVFNPGLSSKEQEGEFSGRGVGMDAIKFEVEKLGGHVKILSELGRGTSLVIEVPTPEKKALRVKAA